MVDLGLESQHGPCKDFVEEFLQVTQSMVVAYVGLIC